MKVAIYCRLSEEDKNKQNKNDDSESIQNQKSMLIKFALDREWEVYNIYSDDDYTGSDRNRPEFNKLLDDAKNKKFNIVLCKTQSRFTRELELVEKYIHGLFPILGIRFISVVDNADTSLKGNKKSRQINGLVNEWYLEDMSESIKSVLNHKRENGVYIGSFPIYGYLKNPNQKGHLIIDKEASEIVKEIFTLYANGYGKSAITNILNKRKIPNPAEYKRLKGIQDSVSCGTNNTLWRYGTISSIIRNEMYIGNLVQGKYGKLSYKTKEKYRKPQSEWIKVENTHEPIIDYELWERVQQLISQKTKSYDEGKIGIFARKIKCKQCGYAMRTNKRENGMRYLRCSTRLLSKDSCIGSSIRIDNLEKIVLDELSKLSEQYLDDNEIVDNIYIQDDYINQKSIIDSQIKQLNKKVSECTESIKVLYTDKLKGLITDDEFIDFSKQFHTDKAQYMNLLNDYEQDMVKLIKREQASNERQQILEEYVNIENLTHEIVEKLIDCIYVGYKDSETKKIPIEIHWNF